MASYGFFGKVDGQWKNLCAANILSNRTLITAAHCLKNPLPDSFSEPDFKILAGKSNLTGDPFSEPFGRVLTINRTQIHPDYNNETAYYDVALIHLNEDIVFSRAAQPICFPTENTTDTDSFNGLFAVVAGWGMQTQDHIDWQSQTLRHVALRIVGHQACNQKYDVRGKSKLAQDRAASLPKFITPDLLCGDTMVSSNSKPRLFIKVIL